MKLQALWDRYLWILALVALAAVLLMAIFGAPRFCTPNEACGRELLIAVAGTASSLVTACSVVYLALQVKEARRQNDLALTIRNEQTANVVKRAYAAAVSLKGTFNILESEMLNKGQPEQPIYDKVFRTMCAMNIIVDRFNERAFDEFENFYVNDVSIATIRRAIRTYPQALKAILAIADPHRPEAEARFEEFKINLRMDLYIGYLDSIAKAAMETMMRIDWPD